MTEHAAGRAIDAIWRMESAKLIAVIARMVQDVGLRGSRRSMKRCCASCRRRSWS
ncbi:hypothetical protein RB620_08085 [Paenibacillus sp. LHD-117]|uniref:hypothetical protein n=1 Tax=Paenibacillus sp. LHD-117 TaxID=3071412 RepID=UPI0027E0CE2E|nr:hypothetical protein [Paenibacillus sp. LHD-117]MDQ6419388.1 hypothetical protein [Paenibacillus sp. LHD-117]